MVNRVAVCSWSLQTKPTNELLHALQRCDLECVQIELDEHAQSEREYEALQGMIDSGQLSICSGMMSTIGEDYSSLERIQVSGGLRPDEHWDANVERAKRCARLAHELDIELVTMHAGYISAADPISHTAMADRICRVVEIFNDQGVLVGLETGQERFDTLLSLLFTISTKVRVGVNFDPANMILYAMGDPTHAMRELSGHIVQVHMKDAIATSTPGTWGTEVVAGTGQVDWDAFFEIVEGLPNAIDVVIEREAGDTRVDDIRTAAALAQRQIRRVRA